MSSIALFTSASAHGQPDDLAPLAGQLVDLHQRGFDVARVGNRHRLHGDRRAATNLHFADADPAGVLPRRHHVSGLRVRSLGVWNTTYTPVRHRARSMLSAAR